MTSRILSVEDGKEDWAQSESGLIVPGYVGLKPRRFTAVDLFCGAGGFSLGIMQAGMTVVAGLDNDCASVVTYLYNLGAYPVQFHYATPEDEQRIDAFIEREYKRQKGKKKGVEKAITSGSNFNHGLNVDPVGHMFFGDVRRFTGQQILDAVGLKRGELDAVVGGPPCQGFSYAGKRNVMDPRNSLVFEFARLVLEMSPKTMVMENVPGMVNMVTPEGVPVLDALCRILEDGGFGVYDAIKQSLLASSGAGAVMRGRARADDEGRRPSEKRKRGKAKREEQLALLP